MAVVDIEQVTVIHNEAAGQFEAYQGDQQIGLIAYDDDGKALLFMHTEVPAAYGNQGVAEKLTREAFEQVKAAGKRVVPLCPYTQAFIRKHPEYKSYT